jgi:hypothetical protein
MMLEVCGLKLPIVALTTFRQFVVFTQKTVAISQTARYKYVQRIPQMVFVVGNG